MKCDTRVVILRSNPVAPDPRVEKTARALRRAGASVTTIGWDRSAALPAVEHSDTGTIHRIPIPANYANGLRNLLPLLRWQYHLLRWLMRHRHSFTHIHACDFDTILPACLASWLLGKAIIYDIFDFFTDVHFTLPRLLRCIIRHIDYWVIEHVDGVIIVDDSRIEQLGCARPKQLAVVYNSPENVPGGFVSSELSETRIPTDSQKRNARLRVAFVGVLSPTRGILEMIAVVACHSDWFLEIAGFGGFDAQPLITAIQQHANMCFHGTVSYKLALSLNARADLLFATYDPRVPNHRYSSANKLFEAMMLGKPIVVARSTGMDRIVEKHELGFVVPYGDHKALDLACSEVASWNEAMRSDFGRHARSIYEQFYKWSLMEERLVRIYTAVT